MQEKNEGAFCQKIYKNQFYEVNCTNKSEEKNLILMPVHEQRCRVCLHGYGEVVVSEKKKQQQVKMSERMMRQRGYKKEMV
jgi:hypothetical protein